MGYAQVENLTLVRMAPWTGVFGLSLVIATVNMLWAIPVARLRRPATASFLSLAGVLTASAIWLQFRGPVPPAAEASATAVLVQENLSVGAGAQEGVESREAMLASFAALSRHPEFPRPAGVTEAPNPCCLAGIAKRLFLDSDEGYRDFMEKLARTSSAPILADNLSLAGRNSGGSYNLYNSVTFFREDGNRYGGAI